MIKLECGDIIKMKKKHPCGSDEWEVIKVGAGKRYYVRKYRWRHDA